MFDVLEHIPDHERATAERYVSYDQAGFCLLAPPMRIGSFLLSVCEICLSQRI
jgi:hypothetical protein